MPTATAALARRIVRATHTYTSGKPQQWAPVEAIARIVLVSDDDFMRDALQVGVDRGWLIVEGGGSICLTDEGRKLATA